MIKESEKISRQVRNGLHKQGASCRGGVAVHVRFLDVARASTSSSKSLNDIAIAPRCYFKHTP